MAHPYGLRVSLLAASLALIGATVGILAPSLSVASRNSLRLGAMLLIAASTALPGLIAGVLRHALPSADRGRKWVVQALELAVLGITPAIAVLTTWTGDVRAVIPLVIWIVGVLAIQYLAVRPLARTASVATTQRDQVVAAWMASARKSPRTSMTMLSRS